MNLENALRTILGQALYIEARICAIIHEFQETVWTWESLNDSSLGKTT
jgi:hypothetical protein